MVVEYAQYSLWEKLKRIIAFLLCPEFRNLELKLEHIENYTTSVYKKWYKDVRAKEKGMSRLNKKIRKLQNENYTLKQKIRTYAVRFDNALDQNTSQEKEIGLLHNTIQYLNS